MRQWVRVITTQMEIHVWCKIIHVYGKSTRLSNTRYRQTDKPKYKYLTPSILLILDTDLITFKSSLTRIHSKKAFDRIPAFQMSTRPILHENSMNMTEENDTNWFCYRHGDIVRENAHNVYVAPSLLIELHSI